MLCHFMQSHIHRVHACLDVTCHLHFWQNDRDLLHITVITVGGAQGGGWGGGRATGTSQHTKLAWRRKFSRHSCQVSNQRHFNHESSALTTELFPLPNAPPMIHSSADAGVFRIPSFQTKSSGQCPFSYQAPVMWNQLPVSIHHSTSVSSFKSSLKAFLF